MTPLVSDIVKLLDGIAPFSLAEKWDNSGLQAGHPDWPVHRILVALDVTMDAMTAAEGMGADVLITHHPLTIVPEKSLDFSRMPGAAIAKAASRNIAIISAHTNLDKAREGLNDYFAEAVGLTCDRAFLPEGITETDDDGMLPGIGRFGRPDQPLTVGELSEQVKSRLGVPALRVAGQLNLTVDEVAICTGSGGSLVDTFLNSSAQVYITGDLKYHEARDIEASGRAAIDVGHFASEHIAIDLLIQRLGQAASSSEYEINIQGYTEEKDPFIII
ncbi:MAG: Nif3-like dinuclear metal center hexameric protein [Desulfobacterales bacterium]|nr:Nif3-like dinuclear metal center hexameric protein [Desulfobacterales bacterium]